MFNFRQVTGQSKFRSWKDWKKGEFVVGKVEGFTPNRKNTKFNDLIIKLVDFNFSQQGLEKGDRFALNGNTQLQKFLNTPVQVGDVVKVVYLGTEIVKTGEYAGAKTHCVEGYIADQETEDVAAEASELLAKSNSVL